MKKYWIITYGCQMNKSDSERIAAAIEKNNYQKAENKETADLVVFNACSVRQSAVDRLYGQINQLKKSKKNPQIFLTGCVTLNDKKKLKSKVDLIFDIKDLTKVFNFSETDDYLHINPKYSSPFRAFIPISVGCNNFCSYCVVPYVRGKEICRPFSDILEEAKSLIKAGYKEIILLGQNVNSYQGRSKNQKSKNADFVDLLKTIENIPGDFWLSFISNHPKDLSSELIELMAKSKKICPYLHLPVQSGDNEMLKLMNRNYTIEEYKEKIALIRQKIKNITISTDIIVGLPSETKKQFDHTRRLMKELKFDMAYIAQYSPRPFTALAKLDDNVPPSLKAQREKILFKILKETALINNKKYINQIMDTLIEERKFDYLFGHSKNQKHVRVLYRDKNDLIGQFVKVKIKKAAPWGLEGEII
jgi:tRNA-2-methylthio-N6-dimethylallyladenosine synthase